MRGGHGLDVRDDVFLAQDLQRREAGGAGRGMPGIGEAVAEFSAAPGQYLRDALADHHTAERLVAVGDRLGEGHQVWLHAVVDIAEPFAGAPETADHLVHDQQDVVLREHATHFGPVALGCNDHAAGALHRLGDERGHVVGPEFLDPRLERARGLHAEFLRRQARALAVPVRLLDVRHVGQRLELLVHEAHAAEARAGDRAAVVGVDAADDPALLRLFLQVPVAAHHAHHGVVALAARVREEHVLHVRRRDRGQHLRQFDRGRVRALEEVVVEGQLLQLLRYRVHDLAAAVAEVAAPQSRHGVEILAAFDVVDVDVLGTRDHARALRAQLVEVREGVQVMGAVERLPVLLGSVCARHRVSSCRSVARTYPAGGMGTATMQGLEWDNMPNSSDNDATPKG